jgi:hypothetical protein
LAAFASWQASTLHSREESTFSLPQPTFRWADLTSSRLFHPSASSPSPANVSASAASPPTSSRSPTPPVSSVASYPDTTRTRSASPSSRLKSQVFRRIIADSFPPRSLRPDRPCQPPHPLQPYLRRHRTSFLPPDPTPPGFFSLCADEPPSIVHARLRSSPSPSAPPKPRSSSSAHSWEWGPERLSRCTPRGSHSWGR